MPIEPKTTATRKPRKPKHTLHKVFVITAQTSLPTNEGRLADINGQLNALATDGWAIHITQVDLTISNVVVYGWATK